MSLWYSPINVLISLTNFMELCDNWIIEISSVYVYVMIMNLAKFSNINMNNKVFDKFINRKICQIVFIYFRYGNSKLDWQYAQQEKIELH